MPQTLTNIKDDLFVTVIISGAPCMYWNCNYTATTNLFQGAVRGTGSGSDTEYSEVYSVLNESGREYSTVESRTCELHCTGYLHQTQYIQYVRLKSTTK